MLFSFTIPVFALSQKGTYTVTDNKITYDYTQYSQNYGESIFWFFYDILQSGDEKQNPYSLALIEKVHSFYDAELTNLVVFERVDKSYTVIFSDVSIKTNDYYYGLEDDNGEVTAMAMGLNISVDGNYVTFTANDYFSLTNVDGQFRGQSIMGCNYDIYFKDSGELYYPASVLPDIFIEKEEEDSSYNEDSLIGGLMDGIANFFNEWRDEFIDIIVGLFIPEEGYLENWANQQMAKFENNGNILFYPFTVLTTFYNKFTALADKEPILRIQPIEFMDVEIFPYMEYNFNSLLTDARLEKFYNIYLLCYKAALGLGLCALIRNRSDAYGM